MLFAALFDRDYFLNCHKGWLHAKHPKFLKPTIFKGPMRPPYTPTHKITIRNQDSSSLVAGISRARRPYSSVKFVVAARSFRSCRNLRLLAGKSHSQEDGEVGRSKADNLFSAFETSQIQRRTRPPRGDSISYLQNYHQQLLMVSPTRLTLRRRW